MVSNLLTSCARPEHADLVQRSILCGDDGGVKTALHWRAMLVPPRVGRSVCVEWRNSDDAIIIGASDGLVAVDLDSSVT
jgi:hypothetical protein